MKRITAILAIVGCLSAGACSDVAVPSSSYVAVQSASVIDESGPACAAPNELQDEYERTARQKFDEQAQQVMNWCDQGDQNACKRYEHMLNNRTKLVREQARLVQKDARVQEDKPAQVCSHYHQYHQSYERWRESPWKLCERI